MCARKGRREMQFYSPPSPPPCSCGPLAWKIHFLGVNNSFLCKGTEGPLGVIIWQSRCVQMQTAPRRTERHTCRKPTRPRLLTVYKRRTWSEASAEVSLWRKTTLTSTSALISGNNNTFMSLFNKTLKEFKVFYSFAKLWYPSVSSGTTEENTLWQVGSL